ncbi:MAG: NAD(P)H-hydrate dehydratase [Bacteroidaceae bacterium]|nr:NAD(P)H-hydrate dehydratase [Bacteroidaceae bacterium]
MTAEQLSPQRFTLRKAEALIIPRKAESHKGDYGHALLAAGSRGMAGAAIMASRACLRSGVGLLSVATPECNRAVLQTAVPEAMIRTSGEHFCCENITLPNSCSALAAGPGMGTEEKMKDFLFYLIDVASRTNLPVVLDADALNILSTSDNWWKILPPKTILTPHTGEFNRLLRPFSLTYTKSERLSQARMLAQKANACVVLKGHETVVASPEGQVSINTTGNPGMATGGSGDVLTGIVLALCAQGYQTYEAARLGVFAHGLAGDFAAEKLGQTSLIATDIIAFLPEAWKKICRF